MFLVLGIIAGFGAGCWLPTNTNLTITIGMIAAAIIPFSSIFGVMFLSGYLVASYLQNSFITNFTASKKDLDRAYAVHEVKLFLQTFALAVLAFALVNGTSLTYALMFYSAYLIFSQLFADLPMIIEGGKSLLMCIAGFSALITAAILTILNIDKVAIFAFFLAIRTFPSIIGKTKNIKNHRNQQLGNAFAYAMGGDGPYYNAILLAQTIMWGSQKDAIGTVINAALGSSLDPIRFIWALTMFICIVVFYTNIHRLQKRIDRVESTKVKKDPIAQPFTFGVSLFFAIVMLGWLHTVIIMALGLVVALCLPIEIINKFAVPSLLVCGIAL